MSFILLTNDDGAESPALLPLARELEKLARVRVVVPDGERSWVGKAISRWDAIEVRAETSDGLELIRVTGSPADCANLGVHSLFEARPDMVVSGVNVGLNTGVAFFLSSGTVGAAMEGWLAGLPALAFSVGVPGDDKAWKRGAQRDGETWERAAALSADIVRTVREAGFPAGVDLLNINFSVNADLDTPRVVTEIAGVGYEQLFRRVAEGRFVHEYEGALVGDHSLEGTDVVALREGRVSITPVRLAQSVPLDPGLRQALERRSP